VDGSRAMLDRLLGRMERGGLREGVGHGNRSVAEEPFLRSSGIATCRSWSQSCRASAVRRSRCDLRVADLVLPHSEQTSEKWPSGRSQRSARTFSMISFKSSADTVLKTNTGGAAQSHSDRLAILHRPQKRGSRHSLREGSNPAGLVLN
jgi:hypothetical protein